MCIVSSPVNCHKISHSTAFEYLVAHNTILYTLQSTLSLTWWVHRTVMSWALQAQYITGCHRLYALKLSHAQAEPLTCMKEAERPCMHEEHIKTLARAKTKCIPGWPTTKTCIVVDARLVSLGKGYKLPATVLSMVDTSKILKRRSTQASHKTQESGREHSYQCQGIEISVH